jgi:hypothetical protein
VCERTHRGDGHHGADKARHDAIRESNTGATRFVEKIPENTKRARWMRRAQSTEMFIAYLAADEDVHVSIGNDGPDAALTDFARRISSFLSMRSRRTDIRER